MGQFVVLVSLPLDLHKEKKPTNDTLDQISPSRAFPRSHERKKSKERHAPHRVDHSKKEKNNNSLSRREPISLSASGDGYILSNEPGRERAHSSANYSSLVIPDT